jgi:DNA (cytosine-5)-methyltransferase 1
MNEPLTFGSLFAGIGGFDLGFERAGMKCRWQVEIDPYCQRVLAKHWPDVRRWPDVRTFLVECAAERVDVICGGFPCQDISPAGTKAGIDGARSGLWKEFARIVRVLMPRFVVVENSAALLDRGMERVLGDLAACGFDAEWEVLSACAFGAPHTRERVFIVANSDRCELRTSWTPENQRAPAGLHQRGTLAPRQLDNWWAIQPEPCSVVYGVPGIVDRLRPYGNSVVPQAAEWIGKRIVASLNG